MKRIFAGLVIAVATLAVAVPGAISAPATAVIDVVFNTDGSATITSSKGVSHYVVTLCDGTETKVELSGRDKVVTVGPFSSPIVSITAKSATSVHTEASGVDCGGTPPPPPPCDEKDPNCEPTKP